MDRFFGVLGGMGTVASTEFLNQINDHHPVKKDQDHLNYVVWNNAEIPDRTSFILGDSEESPLPALTEGALALEKLGASFIAMPCNTAHFFYEDLQDAVGIPILNMLDLTAQKLADEGVQAVGLMATRGTILSKIYVQAFQKHKIQVYEPDAATLDAIMSLIYDGVKSSGPIDYDLYADLVQSFLDGGAERVILGCTELSVINQGHPDPAIKAHTVDAQDVLAQETVRLGQALKARD